MVCAASPTRFLDDPATEKTCWRYVGVMSIGPSFQDYCGIVCNVTMAPYLHTKLWLCDQDGTLYKPYASFACVASTSQTFFAPKHNSLSIPTKISVPLSIDIKITIGARGAARTGAQGLPKCKTSSGWINAEVRLSLQPLQTIEARTSCAWWSAVNLHDGVIVC